MADQNRPKPASVAMRDRQMDGWLNEQTGELTRGVYIDPAHTVIDVGCGDGRFINFCAARGAEVIFADRNEAKIRATEERVKSSPARAFRAIVSECAPIPLEDDVGDLVICTEVLEHVVDPVVFLQELVRIAKPGATLLMTVPDGRSENFVAATAPPSYFEEPNHIRIFHAEDFRQLVIDAGLEIVDHQFLGCFWSVYWPLSWLTTGPGSGPGLPIDNLHPITVHWTKLWHAVQQHPQGSKIRDALNALLPQSQCIVARKVG
jgi:ubiquinone/menaquinone biosynthesis C-methylase UbiE